MALAGILASCGYAFASNRGGRAGRLPGDDLLHILLLAVVGAIIGAKVFGALTSLPAVIRNWDLLWRYGWQTALTYALGGLVFYGGAIGGFFAVAIYCKKYDVSLKTTVGLLTPVIPLFHTFGRVGCFLGGCCWGIEVPFGVVYTLSPSNGAPNGVPLLPVQLIEAGCNFILFLFLARLTRRLKRKWAALPVYVMCYGTIRFVLEFFRGDKLRGVALLSSSQWISIALMAAVIVLYFTRWRKAPEENAAEENAAFTGGGQ
jgi:phosphatidylglycerol:prolipoprotein diacylglycerol transferase